MDDSIGTFYVSFSYLMIDVLFGSYFQFTVGYKMASLLLEVIAAHLGACCCCCIKTIEKKHCVHGVTLTSFCQLNAATLEVYYVSSAASQSYVFLLAVVWNYATVELHRPRIMSI